MSTLEIIKEFLKSEDFKVNYSDYLKKKDNTLLDFLDNIDLNKKYYRMNINKNKRYKKETTEDTSSIKEINSMINKITDTDDHRYLDLKSKFAKDDELDILKWKKGGKHIVVFPPSWWLCNNIGLKPNKVLEDTIEELKKHKKIYINCINKTYKLIQ